jgi:hypothetical protein
MDSPEHAESYSAPVAPDDVYGNHRFEQDLFYEVGVILPPKKLLGRHPAIEAIVKNNKLTEQLARAAKDEVYASWKPNPTVFDPRLDVCGFNTSYFLPFVEWIHLQLETDAQTKMARAIINGYPEVIANPHDGLGAFHGIADRRSFNLTKLPLQRERKISKTTFATLQRFFELVVEGLQELKGRLIVELVVEDLITGLPRFFASGRPSSYPTKFTRMWLSNVP